MIAAGVRRLQLVRQLDVCSGPVVESYSVKDILRLPILFLFVFLLLFLLLFALHVLTIWGGAFSEGRETALRVVEAAIPAALITVLPAAILLTLVIVLGRIAVKPGNRFLSLILPLAAALLLLALGYPFLHGFLPPEGAGANVTARRYLAPGVFNHAETKLLYAEQVDEGVAGPIVLAEAGSSDQKLLYFPRGRVETGGDSVSVRMAGYTLEIDPQPVFAPLFAGGPVLRSLLADLSFLNNELKRSFGNSLAAFYFAALALVLAFYGGGMFFRLTRWHLLNLALALLVFRAFLALFRFMREGVVLELDKVLRNPQAVQFLPELVLLVLGGLLLLLDLLFVPFHRREQE